ncbi:MAG TPA: TorF family putative porin [Xanthobacteraceae bacterium]|jgi:uncharacterized protein (TIGR02001 family)|nr:TorF family putative porin [Xanthobacteraceae bacterium]
MKRVALSLVLAAGLATSSAMAADMATKAPPAPPPPPSPWDVAITAALMTDYNFRGVTQSAHHPSAQAGFEPRYNFNSTWQGYVGISGESIEFPNDAAAEIDFYGGIRPTFDKLALDFGVWYYWYPGGNCFGNVAGSSPVATCTAPAGATVPNKNLQPLGGNVAKSNASFYEVYAKATYTINDQWAVGAQYYYSPSVSNLGATGNYITGNITYTEPSSWWGSTGIGGYISGDVGYWALGKSDNFYGTGVVGSPFFSSVQYTDYWNWDAGLGFTYKAFTLDLRYYDSSLNQAQCSVLTSASNATFSPGNVTTQNPTGLGSNWCGSSYIAKLSFATNLSSIK